MSHLHEHHHAHDHDHDHAHHHDAYPPHECDGEGHAHHHHADGTCCCEQHAKEFHGIDKPMLIRLILAAVCYLAGILLPCGETVERVLMLLCAVAAGYDIVFAAVKNLLKLRVFDEYFLMSFAAAAAFLIGEYEEAAAVFLLYRVGAFCQSYAIRHSRRTIATLTGDCGCEVEENQMANAAITRFSRVYTPIILAVAVLIAVLLPLFGSLRFRDSVYRALTFLVLACPCAIVISVPLAYFAAIGSASRSGIFFHDSEAVDAVAAAGELRLTEVTDRDRTVFTWQQEAGQAVNAAPVVLLRREDGAKAVRIAKWGRRIALENIFFVIGVKLAVLILAAFGISALWFAVFADSGVTVIVVLNSLRAFWNGRER